MDRMGTIELVDDVAISATSVEAGPQIAKPQPAAPTDAQVQAEVDRVPYWYHAIDVGRGITTPGWIKNQQELLTRLHMPPSLRGQTVLDVGAWDGFYSFEAERRGAQRVLATDAWVWDRCYGMDGFLTARRLRGSNVEYKRIDPHDISPETVGEFDVTIFSGVYYHLRDPLAVLDRLASVTRRLLIVESMVLQTPGKESVPISRFFEGAECFGDMSNWWAPNVECLAQTVRSAGFARVDVVHGPKWYRHGARSAWRSYIADALSPFRPARSVYTETDRAVVHAFKGTNQTADGNYEQTLNHDDLCNLRGDAFPNE